MNASGGSSCRGCMAQPSFAILTTCSASSSAIARLRSGSSRAPPRSFFAQSSWAGLQGFSTIACTTAFTTASFCLDASASAAVALILS
eukprot:5067489-Prymnesium_polylepis.1